MRGDCRSERKRDRYVLARDATGAGMLERAGGEERAVALQIAMREYMDRSKVMTSANDFKWRSRRTHVLRGEREGLLSHSRLREDVTKAVRRAGQEHSRTTVSARVKE